MRKVCRLQKVNSAKGESKCVFWPHDTLNLLFARDQEVLVVSEEALCMYRQQHHFVVAAYQNYLQEQF